MKGRHQFRRRFSLQPSFLKEEPEEDRRAPRYVFFIIYLKLNFNPSYEKKPMPNSGTLRSLQLN